MIVLDTNVISALMRTEPDPAVVEAFTEYRKTHNEGVFDAYTIAFGMRNITNIDRALSEAHRVLKPGGRFLCLEFFNMETPGLDTLYDLYSFHVMPLLGGLIGGSRDAYQYLAESIRRFPDQRPVDQRQHRECPHLGGREP